jgi:UDP-N-acetylmuramoyl-tripeptide--D-alanyl-D-alanine ligase
MKNILKLALRLYLKIMAKIAIAVHAPKIIVIAGSINKTFVKEQIARELSAAGWKAEAAARNFNTEIGLPVAVLSLPSGYGSYQAWLPIILSAPRAVFRKNFPRVLVLEFGVSRPGDMKFLLSIARPDIAVISDITARYMENFPSMESLLGEYRRLLINIRKGGAAVLNSDNEKIKHLAEGIRTNMIFFGFGEDAHWKIIESEQRLAGQSAKIKIKGEEKTLECGIDRPGRHQLYALLAAKIIGRLMGPGLIQN